jgi:hypothetical protein
MVQVNQIRTIGQLKRDAPVFAVARDFGSQWRNAHSLFTAFGFRSEDQRRAIRVRLARCKR